MGPLQNRHTRPGVSEGGGQIKPSEPASTHTKWGQIKPRGFQPSSQRVAVTGADASGGQRIMVAVSSASWAPVWRAQARLAAARARALP
jgi:hypothetical protein